MAEMVDRVTQAIVDEMIRQSGRQPIRNAAFSDMSQRVARAAIEAMREPTEAMDVAGRHRCHGVDVGDGSMRMACGAFLGETASEQWRRMIDAALAEETAGGDQ
jgi:hypothetical protein